MNFRIPRMYRAGSGVALLCAAALLCLGADAAETQKPRKPHAAHAAKGKKAGRVKFEKGNGETRTERDRRLQRECKGMPNAGACLGYGS